MKRKYSPRHAHFVSRAEYRNWVSTRTSTQITKYFEMNALYSPIVINTVGILDPHKSQSQIEALNVDFPLRLFDAIQPLNGKLATFGTILEEFPNLCKLNPYLASKLKLAETLMAMGSENTFAHFRLHTWYGGLNLQPHMFLGEIVKAINSNKKFKMSSGKQLREYHHIEDDVSCIMKLLEHNAGGVLQISNGDAKPIIEIAENIFSYFDKESLLQINSSSEPPNENLSTRFQPLKEVSNQLFRPLFPNLTTYLERFIQDEK